MMFKGNNGERHAFLSLEGRIDEFRLTSLITALRLQHLLLRGVDKWPGQNYLVIFVSH